MAVPETVSFTMAEVADKAEGGRASAPGANRQECLHGNPIPGLEDLGADRARPRWRTSYSSLRRRSTPASGVDQAELSPLVAEHVFVTVVSTPAAR